MKNDVITIFCASDSNYLIFLVVMIKSLIINHKTNEKLNICIFDDGIKKSDKIKLSRSIKSNKVIIKWIKTTELLAKKFSKDLIFPKYSGKFPPNIYCRLLIPHIVPKGITKVIYLDSDLILLEDISKLWNIDLQSNVISAVQDMGCKKLGSRWGIKNHKELGLNPNSNYFNSGVLVIDLNKWKNEKISEKVISCINANEKHAVLPDQYGLNVMLSGRWKELGSEWNHLQNFPIKNRPHIIHFAGSRKPIHNGGNINYRDLFFSYLDRTAWKGWRPKIKYLIINADDFGQSKEITRGIISAHENGVVSSTSLIVDGEYSKEAAILARKHPKLGIGLHFIADNFYTGPLFDLDNKKAVSDELNRQYKKFTKLVGKKPTHLDSHHHIHLRKNILPIFINFSKKNRLQLRNTGKIKYIGNFYGQTYDDKLRPHPIHGCISLESLEKIIRSLPEGTTELGCHPGFITPNLKDPYNKERKLELGVLQNKDLKREIERLGIKIINFSNLKYSAIA
jgi:lipopolysaccharide biosynthesis glycosyltransferase